MTLTPLRAFAVTCLVPEGAGQRLRVQVVGRTVTVAAPDGFTRTFELPSGAATEGLQWQVYGDMFELRVPYEDPIVRTEAPVASGTEVAASTRLAAAP